MSCIVRLLHAGREGTRCAWVVHWLSESVPSWGGKKSDFRISIVVVEVKVDHRLKGSILETEESGAGSAALTLKLTSQ